MPTYSAVTDVLARAPARAPGASDEPSEAQIGLWLDEAEARLNATLARAGITLAVSRYEVVRPYLADEGAGLVRQAYAANGGDGGNLDGDKLRARFDAFLQSILDDPEGWTRALSGDPLPGSAAASRLRSYQTDNRDGLSVSAGDFKPAFTRGNKL